MIQRINAQGAGYGFERLRAKALYWSNIGGRATYRINTVKTPIQDSAFDVGRMGMMTSWSSTHPISGLARYKTSAAIVANSPIRHREVSVFAYIPDDEYYDFEIEDD